ncbi:MAG: iron-sulfur cluster assembly scaffold protein [Pyrinomonadaceae bacterium]
MEGCAKVVFPMIDKGDTTIEEHFLRPRNVGDLKELAGAVRGEACSPVCGAVVQLSLKIDADSRKVAAAQFKAAGCRYLIACASALTECIAGAQIDDAAVLTERGIAACLLDFPPERMRCAALCREALVASLARYRAMEASAHEEWSGEEALICTCFGVAEKTIERVIQTGRLSEVREVTAACNAGGGCGSCQPLIQDILEDCRRHASL